MKAAYILKKLKENGFPAYLVGGCVRDMLLGVLPHDYDAATSARPEEVKAVFCNDRVIETGLRHGTVTVLHDGEPYEITTFRLEEGYSDGRHPDSVRFTDDLSADLSRRDFTINAMAMDENGGVIDLFGGREDLENRTVRAVGDPRKRFEEDALRILRALRFSSRLSFEIEEKTALAVHEMRQKLNHISAERIFYELKEILCGKNAEEVLMRYWDVISEVIPELSPLRSYDQHNPHHVYTLDEHTARAVGAAPPQPELRLAALFHDIGKPVCRSFDENGIAHYYDHAKIGSETAREILLRLHSDKKTIENVVFLIAHHDAPAESSIDAVAKKIRRYGVENYRALIALRRADNAAQAEDCRRSAEHDRTEKWISEILEKEKVFSIRDLAIKGNDLIALGEKQGPDVGRALRFLFEAVINGKAGNNKSELKDYYQTHFKAR